MKNLFYFIVFVLLCSCNSELQNISDSDTQNFINLAERYNFKKIETPGFVFPISKVNTVNDAKKLLVKFSDSASLYKSLTLNSKNISIILQKNNPIEHSSTNKDKNAIEFIDPPYYTYSYTWYFDNNFPLSNVYVTVNYNVDSNGVFTGYQIISGSWGFNIASGYIQQNVNAHSTGGSLVFQIQGQILGGISFANQTITGGHQVQYSGWLQTAGGGNYTGGLMTGGAKQQPIPYYPKPHQ